MAKVVLVSDYNNIIEEVKNILSKNIYDVIVLDNENELEQRVNSNNVDLLLYDCNSLNIDTATIIKKMKLILQKKDIPSILILPIENIDYSLLKYTNAYITRPLNENLFLATVKSNLQMRDNLCILSKNNSDLAKSLYQLNVFYSTATQLAGSLDKSKLIDIMTDSLEQSLSLSLCYAFILNDVNDIRLTIKSLFPITQRLEDAIKLRALLNYKNLFSINPNIEDITITKFSKDKFDEYDLNVFSFDNLLAPVNIKNQCYGVIEVFRNNDFSQDDTKCFTTLIKQVSLPLESAILYEEIKTTNKKLEELEHLKSEFISIVSHELKTPLTAIKGYLDIILKGMTGELNDTMKKFLNLANVNTTRLEAIIKDLLDLSKVEAGKMDFRFEKTNINLPVELVKNSLENLAKERNIAVKVNLDKNLDTVYIDTQRIEQVLTNLISNAIKFTPENGEIEIESKKITADNLRKNEFFTKLPDNLSDKYVQISVKDNGIGIAKENWNKVFEQFKQIENSLSRKVGGYGLGLPIAKRLIEAHKGFIWLNSEINSGSTFYIAIPIMKDKEIFELSLEQDIHKAKHDNINISLFSFREKIVEGKSLIDKILSEEIIRKTSIFKEYSYINKNMRYYYFYTVDVESFVYDFELRQIESFIKSNDNEYMGCDIMYSSVLYPKDVNTINEIKERLNTFSKGETNEKDINS